MPYDLPRLEALLDSVQVSTKPPSFLSNDPCIARHAEQCAKLDVVLSGHWEDPSSNVRSQIAAQRCQKSDFDILGCIGEGQYGTVEAVRCLADNQVYAMKTISKATAVRAHQHHALPVERRLHLLASLDSTFPWAPPLLAAFQTPTSLHLIVEYAPCGSLWDRMSSSYSDFTQPMSEKEISWWGPQIIAAVDWVNKSGYAHRDIKPQNFLLFPNYRLKIADFGSAAPLVPSSSLVDPKYCTLAVGTPDYIAPDILRHAEQSLRGNISPEEPAYNVSVDWWSTGVLLYEMAFGRPPFWAETILETYNLITNFVPVVPIPGTPTISTSFRNLLTGLISTPETRLGRIGTQQIMKHPFFRGIDWSTLSERPPPRALAPLNEFDHLSKQDSFVPNSSDFPDITFGRFFESSMTTSSMLSTTVPREPVTQWLEWSWEPLNLKPSTIPPSPVHLPFTPLRQGTAAMTPRRSLPKSTQKRRQLSDRRAFQQLIQCVGLSARKPVRTQPSIPSRDRRSSASPSPVFPLPQDDFRGTTAGLEKWHNDSTARLERLKARLARIEALNGAE